MPLEYVHNKLVIYTGEEIVGCSGVWQCACAYGVERRWTGEEGVE